MGDMSLRGKRLIIMRESKETCELLQVSVVVAEGFLVTADACNNLSQQGHRKGHTEYFCKKLGKLKA